MGTLERSLIRLFEGLVKPKEAVRASEPQAGQSILLGNAAAPFGRRGAMPAFLPFANLAYHFAIHGSSGAGKTVLALHMCKCLLLASMGFMLIDCHDAVPKFLALVAELISKGTLSPTIIQRIVVLSFSHNDWIVRFNPLPQRGPTESTLAAMQMWRILKSAWPDIQIGPPTAELVRNTFILLADRGLSLDATERLLTNDQLLRWHAEHTAHEPCRNYFLNRHLRKSVAQRRIYTDAFLTRLSVFLSDVRIRAMLSSGESDLDLREAMDQGKIVLVDLNKGQLSENASLLGALFLLSLQHAALARSDIPEAQRRLWPVFVDEHPSFASPVTLTPILDQTRKFGVGLVLIAQTFATMDKSLIQSIRTNCATLCHFRLSPEDVRVATAGLAGEQRELASRQMVELPVGTAMLTRSGSQPQRIKISRCDVPQELTNEQEALIERIRHNVGVPIEEALGGQGNDCQLPPDVRDHVETRNRRVDAQDTAAVEDTLPARIPGLEDGYLEGDG